LQAPAPDLPVEKGRPGPGFIAGVVVGKYLDGCRSTASRRLRGGRRTRRDPLHLLEGAKLNGLDPEAYLADVIDRMARGHPININRLAELLPWNWQRKPARMAA
jgi:hypothetical protein